MNPHPEQYLHETYRQTRAMFEAQPAIVQRFLEAQANQFAAGLIEGSSHVHFMLPDRVVVDGASLEVPGNARRQTVGSLRERLLGGDLRVSARQHLADLEVSSDRGLAVAASLMRFACAFQMVHAMLPEGRRVAYAVLEGEEIPSEPVRDELEPESAITAVNDAVVEEARAEEGRGQLIVPFVPAARRFFLPQWVAFDDQGGLLVNTIEEAEAHLASMQRYLFILHAAVALAPYVVADEEYGRKRYGMLGQLVNQGRALARYHTDQVIATIHRRAAAGELNRGLSLTLPFFDDQHLEMRRFNFVVIPAGRIMFVPAFVVRAVGEEQGKVAQDTRLSPSTRKYLLLSLAALEAAFDNPSSRRPAA
ncbi:MAG: hypothetical protein NTY23_12095 [Chloroflexi bacterium]|nr:hypothetical protein [Chloroflexota bacterium]